ncbi:MAG: hypothetical protein ACK4WB_07850 [Desulfatiglandales bacterium]
MNIEEIEKVYSEIRTELQLIEESLSKIIERGKGIPFVEKNVRALKALIYAFKNGLIEPGA